MQSSVDTRIPLNYNNEHILPPPNHTEALHLAWGQIIYHQHGKMHIGDRSYTETLQVGALLEQIIPPPLTNAQKVLGGILYGNSNFYTF